MNPSIEKTMNAETMEVRELMTATRMASLMQLLLRLLKLAIVVRQPWPQPSE